MVVFIINHKCYSSRILKNTKLSHAAIAIEKVIKFELQLFGYIHCITSITVQPGLKPAILSKVLSISYSNLSFQFFNTHSHSKKGNSAEQLFTFPIWFSNFSKMVSNFTGLYQSVTNIRKFLCKYVIFEYEYLTLLHSSYPTSNF